MNTNLNSRTNFTENNYLYNCDIGNKYLIKNVHSSYQFEKIIITISLKDFNVSGLKNKNYNSIIIKSTLFFLFFLNIRPFVNFKKHDTLISDVINGDYSLKIVLSNQKDINNFLFYIFYENFLFIKQENFFDKQFVKTYVLKNKKSLTSYSLELPLKMFPEFSGVFNTILTNINLNDVKIKINFFIVDSIKSKNNFEQLKNLPFF